MKRPARLGAAAIARELRSLPGWTVESGALRREYRFTDFSQAFGFMARAALAAERLDHHPDWSNSWNRVTVSLSTHDAGGITTLDFRLAHAMEALAAGPPGTRRGAPGAAPGERGRPL